MKTKKWLYISAVAVLLVVVILLFSLNRKLPTTDENPAATTTTIGSTSSTSTTTSATATTTETVITTTTTSLLSTSKTTISTTTATKVTKTTTTKTTKTTAEGKPVIVQAADWRTGISWDGVSPIVYTYPDGSTGTELKDGAKYEVIPGLWETYRAPRDGNNRLIGDNCNQCGKQINYAGSGEEYCYQSSRSRYCDSCGIFLHASECHSCIEEDKFYCSDCGKVSGNGLNGTCVVWMMGDVDCPNCGEHVEAYTCHTCEK